MFDDVKEVNDGCGNFYYVNTATGASGWTKEEAADIPLPSGVVAGFDEASGYAYYCHEASGATGWSVEEVLEAARQLSPSKKEPTPLPWENVPASPQPPTPLKGPPVVKDAPNLSLFGHYDGRGGFETHSREQSWLLEDAFARGVNSVRLACPANPIGFREFEVRFGDNAVSERVPTPPSTRMIQVNLDSGATRVVRRIAPCDDVIDDAKTHSGEILRCRGLLLKKGGGTSLFGRRKWQDRFVDLDPVMGTITYYSDRERRHKKGSLKVGAATRVSDDASGKHFKGRAKDVEDPCYFVISLLVDAETGKPREGALELRAPNRAELEKWKVAIEWAVATAAARARHRLSSIDRKDAPPLPKRVSKRVSSDSAPPPLPPRTPVHTPPGPLTAQKPVQDEEVFYDAVQSPARKLFPQASPATPSPSPKKEPKMRGKTWGDRLNAASAAPAPEPAPAPAPARPKPPPPPPKPTGDPALAKYQKMLNMKLPQGAVEQKMRADGVDPSLLFPDAAPAPKPVVLPKPRKKTVHLQLHAGGDLMAQLKAGTKLKKVEVSAPLGPPPPKAMSAGDGGIGGLAEAIAASQKRRAKALANLP